jgi:PKD repeat protein
MLRAYFSYVPMGLSVRFLNLSSGNPTSYVWDFGVNPTQTSTDEEPIFQYTENGVFQVSLTVSDGTNTDTLILPVGVTNLFTSPALPTLILDAVMSRLPTPLLPTIAVIDGFIKKWELYLACLIDPNISPLDTFDETKWPALVNDLVINLVLYDIITDKVLAAGASAAVGTGSGSGGLKKVVTGPAEAEWFGAGDAAYAMMKAGGLYDQIKQRICILARRLRIPLEFCDGLAWRGMAPTIMKPHHHHGKDQDTSRNNDYVDLHTNPNNFHNP